MTQYVDVGKLAKAIVEGSIHWSSQENKYVSTSFSEANRIAEHLYGLGYRLAK